MFDLHTDVFCRYLSKLDNEKLAVTYKVLECFYESLWSIDLDAHTIFIDILDEVQLPILEECAKRFLDSCNATCRIYEFKNEKEKKNETIN